MGALDQHASTLCPACGFELGFKAWDGELPSFEICPCCQIQFGYTDFAGNDLKRRCIFYHDWRQKWAEEGLPWRGSRPPPTNWDPYAQLAYISRGLNFPA